VALGGGNVTRLQQFILELEIDYCGHPHYISGNALLHAMAPQLEYETQQALRVSHGMFAPAQFGRFPSSHSQTGTRPGMGSSLPPVEQYSDLFLCREPAQSWLLSSRPRDLLNAHDIRLQSGKPAFQPNTIQTLPEDHRRSVSTTSWAVHGYLHATDDSVLPLADDVLDGLQLGGARNYGYGQTSLRDTQLVDLDALSYERLDEADEHRIKLITPYVLRSDDPHADSNEVPWWWGVDGTLRRRREQLVEQREELALETVDHGQTVRYTGDSPVQTAQNGIRRMGTHQKYGFGELRVLPA